VFNSDPVILGDSVFIRSFTVFLTLTIK